MSRIGYPIDCPVMAAVQVLLEKGRHIGEIAEAAENICSAELARINDFCRELGRGAYPVC